jgi:hypothetical protein
VCEANSRGVDAISWRRSTSRWRDYIRESGETASVFENLEGEQVTGSNPNRFMPDYADKQYAKLKDLERGIRADYRSPWTAMLTFTASSTTEDGEPIPPVDHLDELLSSWSAVTRSLRREMEGRRYERLAILEPHKSGYIHVHMAVFVDGRVRPETFAPVIEAHVRNCDLAGEDAHRLDPDDPNEDGVVSVHEVGGDRDRGQLENLGTYLAEYLGTYGDDPLDAPDHQQMANAVLWATGRQRWRPSNGAQEYMATNRGESVSEWEFVGIEDGNGEVHEVSSGGGVARMTTCTDVRETDPPPDGGGDRWGGLHEDRRQ